MHVIVQIKGIDKQNKHDEKFLHNILTTNNVIIFCSDIDFSNFDIYWTRGSSTTICQYSKSTFCTSNKKIEGQMKVQRGPRFVWNHCKWIHILWSLFQNLIFFTLIHFTQNFISYVAFPGQIIHVSWGTPCKYKLFQKCAYVRVHLFFLERCCKYFMRESHKLRLAGLSPRLTGENCTS